MHGYEQVKNRYVIKCYKCSVENNNNNNNNNTRKKRPVTRDNDDDDDNNNNKKKKNKNNKAIPLEACTGPEGSRSMRLPDFKTLGT